MNLKLPVKNLCMPCSIALIVFILEQKSETIQIRLTRNRKNRSAITGWKANRHLFIRNGL